MPRYDDGARVIQMLQALIENCREDSGVAVDSKVPATSVSNAAKRGIPCTVI